MTKKWLKQRKRIFEIIEVGSDLDLISRVYDYINAGAIVINLLFSILYTFDEVRGRLGNWFVLVEGVTLAFFTVDYVLRLLTAGELYDELSEPHALRKYIFSFAGIVDLLSFLPYYLPIFFPAGTVAFRMIRIVRIFRLFRINAYYDSLNVITEVVSGKKQQLILSVFIIVVLMIASSLCMYSLENEAQPEVFSNAFSGIWWAASTLLTVGYGDIYPITIAGKIVSIFITFLGVGMVAIPTGIISAGFVDHYSRIKRLSEYAFEEDILFIEVQLHKRDKWVGLAIKDMELPQGVLVGMVRRGREHLVPRGDLVLKDNDILILGAAALKDENHIDLKRIVLRKQSSWNGRLISELDISRQAMIVMVKRRGTMLIPHDDLRLREGDHIILYSQSRIADAEQIPN